MLANFYQKFIIMGTISCFLFSCAPNYTAHFQQKDYKMSRYTIEDSNEQAEPVALTDAEQEAILEDVEIKKVVFEAEEVQKLVEQPANEVIKPKSKEELIQALKDNPGATVAFNLDKKERKALKREVKEQLKTHKESASIMQTRGGESKILYYILAIFIPPLAVFLWRGIGSDFWINLLLTLLFLIPGIVHAIIVISSKPKMNTRGAY